MRSGRQDGGITPSTSSPATVQPTCSSRRATAAGGIGMPANRAGQSERRVIVVRSGPAPATV